MLSLAVLLASATPSASKNFLHTLFGPPKATRSGNATVPAFLRPLANLFSPTPRPRRFAHARRQVGAIRNIASSAGRERPFAARPASRVRIASLAPLSEASKPGAFDEVTSEGDIVSAYMSDPTLRRGDIVVFPEGPRVFNGQGELTSREISHFEDLATSPLVSAPTRQHVLAATATASFSEPKLSFRARPRGGGRGPKGQPRFDGGAAAIGRSH